MSKRIYAGNLPWSVTKEKLEEIFSSAGEIEEALVIANKYTGRSRGFGFVTFKNDADADKAIKEMDRKEVDGRRIIVKEARPPKESQEISEAGEEKTEEEPEKTGEAEKTEEKAEKKPRKRKHKEKEE